ncbi:MAG: trigger factor [Patescibacteria group bacterium]
MKTTVNKLPKGIVELTIELMPEEIKPQLEQAAGRLSKEIKITGFRPGKAPYDLVAKKVGEGTIFQEAGQKIIAKSYPEAVLGENLLVVGQPKIEILKSAPGNPFIYKATTTLLPNVVLGDYKKIKAKRNEPKTSAEDVEKTINNIRKMRAKYTPEERAAQKGDFVEIDVNVYQDKVPVDGGNSKNHPLTIGEGNFIPGFEDNLIGMLKGQTKEFSLNFPKDYHAKNLAGRKADFKVIVHKVSSVQLPEFNDAFVKQLGDLGNAVTFRKKIKDNLKAEDNLKADRKFEDDIIRQLVKSSRFDELPDLLIDSELDKMLEELKQEVTGRGMKWDEYLQSMKKTEDGMRQEFKTQAANRVKAALVIRFIAKEQKVAVTKEELAAETIQAKEKYKDQPELAEQFDSPSYQQYIENLLANRKVIQYLKEQVLRP